MKRFWTWLLSLFGIKPSVLPQELIDNTTAYVEPEDYDPTNYIDDDYMPDDELINELDEEDEEPLERLSSKFAVIIGINKYDPTLNSDLNGCVNDAEAMYKVLTETYKFPHDNIRMLTDFRATRDNIMERIEWLLEHDIPGDELVLHYSGHSSQVRDRDNDELNDYLDEILCPTDLDWDYPLTDDDIRWVFAQKAEDVFLTFICDSCHSGTITKAIDFSSITPEHPDKPRYIKPPIDIKSREGVEPLPVHKIGVIDKNDRDIISQEHVLLSGCRDDQTSADAYIDGKWQGALTSSLIAAIKKNPNRDWSAIHADVISILNVGGYSQRPQLSGEDNLIKGRTIFGA